MSAAYEQLVTVTFPEEKHAPLEEFMVDVGTVIDGVINVVSNNLHGATPLHILDPSDDTISKKAHNHALHLLDTHTALDYAVIGRELGYVNVSAVSDRIDKITASDLKNSHFLSRSVLFSGRLRQHFRKLPTEPAEEPITEVSAAPINKPPYTLSPNDRDAAIEQAFYQLPEDLPDGAIDVMLDAAHNFPLKSEYSTKAELEAHLNCTIQQLIEANRLELIAESVNIRDYFKQIVEYETTLDKKINSPLGNKDIKDTASHGLAHINDRFNKESEHCFVEFLRIKPSFRPPVKQRVLKQYEKQLSRYIATSAILAEKGDAQINITQMPLHIQDKLFILAGNLAVEEILDRDKKDVRQR